MFTTTEVASLSTRLIACLHECIVLFLTHHHLILQVTVEQILKAEVKHMTMLSGGF